MKKLILIALMLIGSSWDVAEGKRAQRYHSLEEFIEFVHDLKNTQTTIKRSYQVETTIELVLARGQAAHLDFKDNPSGVAEFIFFYDGEYEEVHVIYRCTDDTEKQYNSTSLDSERLRDSRWICASGAPPLKCFTEWEQKAEQACVKFRTERLSEEDRQEMREREMRWEAVQQEARSVREWDLDEKIKPLKIIMDDPNDPNIVMLREKYNLEQVVHGAADDYERLRLLLAWVQKRWQHHGNNTPSQSDPLTILKEASEGKRFRCVEYAIVVAACARSLGMPSRRLALKRSDVETAKSGAGHVVAEVWLKQFNKWVFVDGQWGAIAERDGVPLNAVEFQDAIARKTPGLKIRFASIGDQQSYIKWIAPYLYYLDFNLDQRFFGKDYDKRRYTPIRGKIMLVPKGAKKPKVFQVKTPIKNCTYISNPNAFYPQMNGT